MQRLSDIAEITIGATPKAEGQGASYLRLGNIVAGQFVGETSGGPPPMKGHDARLQAGDILVRGRGPDLSAVLTDARHAGAYPTIELYVVRIDPDRADPAYVVAHINQPLVQAELAQAAQGTGFVRLNRPTLADLAIPLPPLVEQRMIGSLAHEAQCEQSILQKIAERKKQLHSELLHLAMAKARAGEIHPQHERNTGLNDALTSSALPSVPKQKVP
jgi:hypothetical protein